MTDLFWPFTAQFMLILYQTTFFLLEIFDICIGKKLFCMGEVVVITHYGKKYVKIFCREDLNILLEKLVSE